MNMSPKVRPLWQRVPLMIGTSMLLLYKFLHLPRFILPRDFRSVVTNWEYEMFWVLLKSRFTRAYIDQPGGVTLDDCERFSRRFSVS